MCVTSRGLMVLLCLAANRRKLLQCQTPGTVKALVLDHSDPFPPPENSRETSQLPPQHLMLGNQRQNDCDPLKEEGECLTIDT